MTSSRSGEEILMSATFARPLCIIPARAITLFVMGAGFWSVRSPVPSRRRPDGSMKRMATNEIPTTPHSLISIQISVSDIIWPRSTLSG